MDDGGAPWCPLRVPWPWVRLDSPFAEPSSTSLTIMLKEPMRASTSPPVSPPLDAAAVVFGAVKGDVPTVFGGAGELDADVCPFAPTAAVRSRVI